MNNMYPFSHEQLAASLHHHLEQAYLALAQAFQPTWNHDFGGTWFFSKHTLPLCNGVLQTTCTSGTEANQLIQHITQQAKERQVPFLWLVGPSSTPTDLPPRLEAYGLTLDETVVGMVLNLQMRQTLPEDRSQHSHISVRVVETYEQMEMWLRTFATGFGLPEAVAQTFYHLLQTSGFVPHPSHQFFLGTLDSIPVGTSLLFLDGQMAGIYGVATVPSHRKRGVGTKMTQAAIEEARRLKYSHITLQATKMGESIYRQLGFHAVCSFQTYHWTPGSTNPETSVSI